MQGQTLLYILYIEASESFDETTFPLYTFIPLTKWPDKEVCTGVVVERFIDNHPLMVILMKGKFEYFVMPTFVVTKPLAYFRSVLGEWNDVVHSCD